MNFDKVPTELLRRAAGKAPRGMGDFVDQFADGIRPATSMPLPAGPADFPVTSPVEATPTTEMGWLQKMSDTLLRLYGETVKQNIAARPVTRCKDITQAGQTLDWTSVGIMDRLTLKNDGPDPVWISFDMSGPAVNAFTSDLSFALKADSSINLSHSLFSKIGVKTAAGKTATVNAIGWQTVAGNQAAAIS